MNSLIRVSLFIFLTLSLYSKEQLLLATAPNENSHLGSMTGYERDSAKSPWKITFPKIPVIFGEKGLAWGRGLHSPQPGLQKKEGDRRAPAGRFKVGFSMGYAPQLPSGNRGWSYHQVTERDAWIDDPAIPHLYNHLFTLKSGEPEPTWFQNQRKRLGDFAYAWKILIEHNYDRPIPGEGSAIFFHIRRGETKPSVGCTVMAENDLIKILCWLDPQATSVEYVLLSEKDYQQKRASWNLP